MSNFETLGEAHNDLAWSLAMPTPSHGYIRCVVQKQCCFALFKFPHYSAKLYTREDVALSANNVAYVYGPWPRIHSASASNARETETSSVSGRGGGTKNPIYVGHFSSTEAGEGVMVVRWRVSINKGEDVNGRQCAGYHSWRG